MNNHCAQGIVQGSKALWAGRWRVGAQGRHTLDQGPQHLVDGVGGLENRGDIRIEHHHHTLFVGLISEAIGLGFSIVEVVFLTEVIFHRGRLRGADFRDVLIISLPVAECPMRISLASCSE